MIGRNGWGHCATACGAKKGSSTLFRPAGPFFAGRLPIGGGYASAAVVGDRVFVTDRVLASRGQESGHAFARNQVDGKEGVSCLDDKTGKVLWRHEYPCPYEVSYASGPRCTPVVKDGRVYTLDRWAISCASKPIRARWSGR